MTDLEFSFRASVECHVCYAQTSITLGEASDLDDKRVDDEVIRRAAAEHGIRKIDVPSRHRALWICAACAEAIIDAFSIDANPNILPAAPASKELKP